MSMVVFAGSSQFIAVSMLSAGVSTVSIVATALIAMFICLLVFRNVAFLARRKVLNFVRI
jgi:hypothetical protein